MPGTYVVDHSDNTKPQIVIPPLSFDHSTSLKMVGYRSPVYGELIWENMLHTMEHFASDYPPVNPTPGQMWYDTGAQELKLYDSVGVWQLVWPIPEEVIVSPSQPPTEIGLLWHNTAVNKLYICDTAGTWQLVWPTPEEVIVSPVQPAYETGLLWHNTATNKLYICDTNNAWQLVWPIPEEVIVSPNQPANEIGLLWHNTAVNKLYICDTAGIWQLIWPIEQPSPPGMKFSAGYTGTSASLCIFVGGDNFPAPQQLALFQARSVSWVYGGGSIGGNIGGSYVAKTITNTYASNMLVKATLYPICDLYETTGQIGRSATYIHNVGEVLEVTPQGFGQNNTDVYPDWTYNQITTTTGNSSPYIPSVIPNPSWYGYTKETSPPAVFYKLLAPNESVTIYGQWWLAQTSPGNFVCHGGSRLVVEGFSNAEAF